MSHTRPDFHVENEVAIARAKASTRQFLQSETHVIVGDHEPEPRAEHRAVSRFHAWKLDTPIMSRDRATLERRIDNGETSIPREMWDASILSGRP